MPWRKNVEVSPRAMQQIRESEPNVKVEMVIMFATYSPQLKHTINMDSKQRFKDPANTNSSHKLHSSNANIVFLGTHFFSLANSSLTLPPLALHQTSPPHLIILSAASRGPSTAGLTSR